MYQELSSKVMEKAYAKITPGIKAKISSCQTDMAWQQPGTKVYDRCTDDIGLSIGLTSGDLKALEKFTAHNLNSNISSEMEIGQLGRNNIDAILQYVHHFYGVHDNRYTCGK